MFSCRRAFAMDFLKRCAAISAHLRAEERHIPSKDVLRRRILKVLWGPFDELKPNFCRTRISRTATVQGSRERSDREKREGIEGGSEVCVIRQS